jgi:hypothetical protein
MGLILEVGMAGNNPNAQRLFRDKLVNNGTFLAVDALKTYSWPGGTPSNGSIFTNLKEQPPNGTHNALVTSFGAFAGGFVCNGTAGNPSNNFNFGSSWIPLANNCLVAVWLKPPAETDTVTLRGAFGRGINTTNNAFYISSNTTNAVAPAAENYRLTIANSNIFTTTCPRNVPTQLALAKIGTTAFFYKNGILVSQQSCNATFTDRPTDSLTLGLVGGFASFRGTFYRALVEDLTVSGKSAAAQVALDYALNSSRFS